MKIDNVAARLVVVPLGAARGGSGATSVQVLHVTVHDTDGASGTGFTYALTGGIEGAHAILTSLYTPAVTGLDPLDWERTWHRLWAATHRVGRGVALPALSALDIAMWDLRARRAGLPLFRLLGAHRDTVPIYGSGRATHQMSDDDLVAGALSYVEEGYRAVKLRAGVHGVEADVRRVARVREAVGPEIVIMVDCNERLTAADAQRLGHRLGEHDVAWMEEPLPSDDVRGHALLAARCPVPIAVGEHLLGRFEAKQYLDEGACAVLMPDAPLAGGISECLRIATLAEAASVAISPHFLPELHVHLAAAAKSATYVEHFPLIDDLLAETLTVRDGMAVPPDRPGHGMRWNPEALDHYTVKG
ncbi:mandelate racemase/muconate lactonizing enzyme family protein [Nonomuraea sp. FMUSA5-5]|uniref:Mandelate racemase/muconate lactonizing enzyme family protein n=1 Tax=Nonomuraea composti TaxID=2720023 RepID=A0ABX1BGI2_9ACTN|nr:mandelate racemase/muconate lactonizing enzyme family protein [Nonomuraea sp. FMUSA5-5]NJP94849.1 mandelate racemase/muconate lactonizing enzyme family protein [Nonomuraea sp. FMUSA5-5]